MKLSVPGLFLKCSYLLLHFAKKSKGSSCQKFWKIQEFIYIDNVLTFRINMVAIFKAPLVHNLNWCNLQGYQNQIKVSKPTLFSCNLNTAASVENENLSLLHQTWLRLTWYQQVTAFRKDLVDVLVSYLQWTCIKEN